MSSEDQMIPMAQQQQQQQPPPTQQNTNYNDNEWAGSSPSPQHSSSGPPPQVVVEYKENTEAKTKYIVFEVLKIFQICVSLFFIIIGIILSIVFLLTDRDRWYYYPLSTSWHSHIWTSPFDVFLWYSIIISIFGLIGAAGEVLCPQVLYAILTFPFIPYCFIPWLLVHALFDDWHRPPAPLLRQRVV